MEDTFRIVVGVDGSPGADRALRWAMAEAERHGGTVQAVSAFDWPPTEAALLAAPHVAQERRRVEEQLDEAVRLASVEYPEVAVAAEVVAGRPGTVLVESARDADLLVVGSRGHGRLYTAVLGSVSEDCIRRATCPVVVLPVPHPQDQPEQSPAHVETA